MCRASLAPYRGSCRGSSRTRGSRSSRFVRVSRYVEAADAQDEKRTEFFVLLGGLALSTFAAAAIARRLGRGLLHPLRRLEVAAGRLSDDDLSARVDVERKDELGRVSEAFNVMAERLEQSREELSHQAFHDALTGLPNRALFTDRVDHAVIRARRHAESVAVLLLDLDDFKNVNDVLGHSAGDQVLKEIAQRISGCSRTGDTVARLGGDEFAFLIEDIVDTADAARVADRLLQAVEPPFVVSGRELRIGASIGLAISITGSEETDELLRNADLAMYSAKRHDKGRYEIFEPSMHAAVVERLRLEADLRAAIERSEFVLEYQPVLDLESGRAVGAEALVRWQHPERGLVQPGEFIPTAEATGLIVPLGRWVLEQACADAHLFQAHSRPDSRFDVSVNLSLGQLHHPSLVEDVGRILRASVHPVSLVLEITEGAAMHDVDATIRTLRELKRLGVLLALDDFGTGYSSLSYLRQLPIDIVKIDRSFVDDLTTVGQATELMREIIDIARTLGLRAVAEGIERADQALALRRMGCDLGQGYFFSKPVAPDALIDFLIAPGQARQVQRRRETHLQRVV